MSSRLTRSLAGFHALCGMGLPPHAAVPALLEALHELIPSQRNLFDWADDEGRLTEYYVEGPIDLGVGRLYFDDFYNRREREWMPAFESIRDTRDDLRSSHELDHPGFFASDLYEAIWRPLGLHRRVEGIVRARDGRLLGSLVLYRGPEDAPFSRAQERLLADLLPWVGDALSARGRPAPQADDGGFVRRREHDETLVLTLDGECRHASDGASRLLLLAGCGLHAQSLRQPIRDAANRLLAPLWPMLREQAARPPSASWGQPACRGVHDNRYGRFEIEARLLWPPDGRDGSPGAVVTPPQVDVRLRWLQAHGVALARLVRSLPLTGSQAAVCLQLAQGGSHGAIARRFGVAESTVVDHVRKIHRALEVGSSQALRDRLERQLREA